MLWKRQEATKEESSGRLLFLPRAHHVSTAQVARRGEWVGSRGPTDTTRPRVDVESNTFILIPCAMFENPQVSKSMGVASNSHPWYSCRSDTLAVLFCRSNGRPNSSRESSRT